MVYWLQRHLFFLRNLASGRHKKTHKKHKRKQQKECFETTSDSEDNSSPIEEQQPAAEAQAECTDSATLMSTQSSESQKQVTNLLNTKHHKSDIFIVSLCREISFLRMS